MGRLLELHPSCARLAEGVKFYSSAAEQDKAAQMEQQLTTCAPESIQYARLWRKQDVTALRRLICSR